MKVERHNLFITCYFSANRPFHLLLLVALAVPSLILTGSLAAPNLILTGYGQTRSAFGELLLSIVSC